jgi:hypothetical protein
MTGATEAGTALGASGREGRVAGGGADCAGELVAGAGSEDEACLAGFDSEELCCPAQNPQIRISEAKGTKRSIRRLTLLMSNFLPFAKQYTEFRSIRGAIHF